MWAYKTFWILRKPCQEAAQAAGAAKSGSSLVLEIYKDMELLHQGDEQVLALLEEKGIPKSGQQLHLEGG